MSIKENQLPTAQEVTENNLIRTVDENGASQNMTIDQLGGLVGGGAIGGGIEFFNINDGFSYDDLRTAIDAHKLCILSGHVDSASIDTRTYYFLATLIYEDEPDDDYSYRAHFIGTDENNLSIERFVSTTNYGNMDLE